MENKLSLRPVNENDIDVLFTWANDRTVRENSFNTAPIKREDHEKWFAGVLKNERIALYIMMEDDTPVGQIRYNLSDDMTEAEIGYSIDSDYRGRGLGKSIIMLGNKKLKENFQSVKTVIAKVKEGNVPSEKCFTGCGFKSDYKQFKTEI